MPDYDQMSLEEIFKLDVEERLQNLNRLVLRLEKEPENPVLFDDAMREAHSLKAAARIVNNSEAQNIAHLTEEIFEILKKGEQKVSANYIDLFLKVFDAIREIAINFVEGKPHSVSVDFLMKSLEESKKGLAAPAVEKRESEKAMPERSSSVPTVRIGVDRLNKLMNLSGEIYTNALQLEKQRQKAREILQCVHRLNRNINENDLHQLQTGLSDFEKQMDRLATHFRYLGVELQEDVMHSRMLPADVIFEPQTRFVRDCSRESEKKIRLKIEGGQTLVDKNILEVLKDPLSHMVRNACDHGLENPEARAKQGKALEGEVRLSAYQKADRVIIEVEDDGFGLDLERIKEKALEKNLLSADKLNRLTQEELLEFIYLPGFSTAKSLTVLSGRGIGLDVVRSSISKVGGWIYAQTEKGRFTRFVLSLPLTLSVTKTLLVEVGGEIFCFPITRVEEVGMTTADQIKTVGNKEVLAVKGEMVPLIYLNKLWQMPLPLKQVSRFPFIIVGQGSSKVALQVQKLIGEKEVVAKSLDTRLGGVSDISAAAILEDGQVAFIADIDSLLRSSIAGANGAVLSSQQDPAEPLRRKKILIVEDSLTVRELERKVLENFGYEVVTAVDGLEGLNKAKENFFDLIVTDIEMPRMDGFEMVSLLKKDPKLYL